MKSFSLANLPNPEIQLSQEYNLAQVLTESMASGRRTQCKIIPQYGDTQHKTIEDSQNKEEI